MTKYQAKVWRALSTAVEPITACLKHFEAEVEGQMWAGTRPSETTCLTSLARAKVRCMTLNIGSHCFSGCELIIIVLTSGRCVQNRHSKKIRPGLLHFLLHDHRYLLNGEIGRSRPLRASVAKG